MNKKKNIVHATIVGILASSMMTIAAAVPDQPKEWEKCAGIAKKGMNDCGALDGKHQCAGHSTRDNDDNEWVYLPKGACGKVTGGFAVAVKPAKMK